MVHSLSWARWLPFLVLARKLESKCPGQAIFSAGKGPGTDE